MCSRVMTMPGSGMGKRLWAVRCSWPGSSFVKSNERLRGTASTPDFNRAKRRITSSCCRQRREVDESSVTMLLGGAFTGAGVRSAGLDRGCAFLPPIWLRWWGFRDAFARFFSALFAAAARLLRAIHGSAAFLCAAVADRLIVAAVVEAVVVGDFFSGGDVPDGRDPYTAFDFPSFAIGVATVVDEHRGAVAVDDDRAVSKSKEIGDGRSSLRRRLRPC